MGKKTHKINKSIKKTLKDYGLIEQLMDEEIFIKLNTTLYPEIPNDRYFISNKGRIVDTVLKDFKTITTLDPSIYESPYGTVNIINKSYLVHRLMMASFEPLEVSAMKKLCVDHIDGDKLNNNLNNLRWVTTQENAIYARDNGLIHPRYGEDHPCCTITEKTCRCICSLLESGKYRQKEISSICNVKLSIVQDISKKKSWKHISCDYDFSNNSIRKSTILSFEEIHKVCKFYEDNQKDEGVSIRNHSKKALKSLGYTDDLITESMVDLTRKLYTRKKFKSICSKYSY